MAPPPPHPRSAWGFGVREALDQELFSRETTCPHIDLQITVKYSLQFYSSISINDIGKRNHLYDGGKKMKLKTKMTCLHIPIDLYSSLCKLQLCCEQFPYCSMLSFCLSRVKLVLISKYLKSLSSC